MSCTHWLAGFQELLRSVGLPACQVPACAGRAAGRSRRDWLQHRDLAVHWARSLLKPELAGRCVILDTETTGLPDNEDAEVISVSIIATDGRTIVDTLIRPSRPLTDETRAALAINPITEEQLAAAPEFAQVQARLQQALAGRVAVAYNAGFDEYMVGRRFEQAGAKPPDARWTCAMHWYARFFGARREDGGYRPTKLRGGDHSSLGDCRATLALMRHMAAAHRLGCSCRACAELQPGTPAASGYPGESPGSGALAVEPASASLAQYPVSI